MEEVLSRLGESEQEVSLALVINNMSGHRLRLEEVDLSCGVFSGNSSMPESILPDTTAVVFIEKVATTSLSSPVLLRIFHTFRHRAALTEADLD